MALAVLAGGIASSEPEASAAGAAATANPPVNATPPSIIGVARQGQTLTATAGSWGGLTPISFGYAWQRCDAQGSGCGAVSGASSQSFLLTSGDVGRTIRVGVTASNGDGSAQVLSDPTGTIAGLGDAPANTRQPDPSGVVQEGNAIHVDEGAWSGTRPISFAYQWERCTAQNSGCSPIAGATARTYTIASTDVGSKLRAQVIATNSAGQGSAFSNLTDVVAARAAPPVNLTLPVITGQPSVGQTLTATSGSWAGASGSFAYQWQRCDGGGNLCSDIHGARGQTYSVGSADAGSTIRVSVTATNASGSTTARSTAHGVPSTQPPSETVDLGGGIHSVPVESLVARPDRLLISQIQFSPNPFSIPNGVFTARFRMIAEGTNNVIRGAVVNLVGIPYGWIRQPGELTSGTDGWVTFQIQTTSQMPLRNGGALVMQVRARAPGQTTSDILGGISTRRLVQLNLTAPR
jgi:hypothetical protein